MNEDRVEREQKRDEAAQRLFALLQQRSAGVIADLEALSACLKEQHPRLAERVNRLVGPAIARTQRIPEAFAALYLLNTQYPPEIIDAEATESPPVAELPPGNPDVSEETAD